MKVTEGLFLDFDVYNEALSDWDIKFKLLSKNNFSAEMTMISNDDFSISREKLNGKLIQQGAGINGYRTIIIPLSNSSNLIYFGKKVTGNQMLIFPKDNSFETISYTNVNVYVISLKEEILFQIIDNLGYTNCKSVFNGEIHEVNITNEFIELFQKLVDSFLNNHKIEAKIQEVYTNNIIDVMLNYIEHSHYSTHQIIYKKKDLVLKKTVEIINDNTDDLFSVQELCSIVGVSRRTLEYAFKDKFKVSPNEYIKAIRLNNVKNELYNFRDEKISVANIAGKYNFWHMGQFAKDFRKQFGFLPSEISKL